MRGQQDTGRTTPVKGHRTNKHTHTAFDDSNQIYFLLLCCIDFFHHAVVGFSQVHAASIPLSFMSSTTAARMGRGQIK